MERPSAAPITAEILARLERYVVEGESALSDALVAEAVAMHAPLVTELTEAVERLRQPLQGRSGAEPRLRATPKDRQNFLWTRPMSGWGSQTLPGGVTIPKLERLSSSSRVSTRENSARHGVWGRGGLGNQTLPMMQLLDATLLDRYLAGECSSAEAQRVRAWIAEDPATRDVEKIRFVRDDVVTDVAWPQLSCTIADASGKPGQQRVAHTLFGTRSLRNDGQGLSIRRLLRYGVLMTAVATALLVFVRRHSPSEQTPALSAQTYVTRPGQRANIHLPDGTAITLAPQTSLVVSNGFGATNRNVQLTGQAYFDVGSAAGQPFTVRTGAMTSRVLGTRFTIRHYPGDSDVRIAVQSGRVMSGRNKSVVLLANTIARLTDSSESVTQNADLREYIEWTSGQLRFTEVPASEITTVLGQWYGLTFRFADSLLMRQHLSGMFNDHDSRQTVLRDLGLLLGARMTFRGDVVTLTPDTMTAVPRRRLGAEDLQTMHRSEVGR